MDTDIYTLDPERSLAEVYQSLPEGSTERRQRLYPVIDADSRFIGVLPWSAVLDARQHPGMEVRRAMLSAPAVAYPDEILRSIADRMAALGLGVLPVVVRSNRTQLVGLVTQFDLLNARQKPLEEERHAERVLTLRQMVNRRNGSAGAPSHPEPANSG